MYSDRRRSRSRGRGGSPGRREDRGERRRRRDEDDAFPGSCACAGGPMGAPPGAAWGPYGAMPGYAGYAAAAANYWDYAQQAQQMHGGAHPGGPGSAGGGEETKKKKKKKKKKKRAGSADSSSSSSSSSDSQGDAAAQWQDMWRSWQQGGGAMQQGNMQGNAGWPGGPPGWSPYGHPAPPVQGWPGESQGGSTSSTNHFEHGGGGGSGFGVAEAEEDDKKAPDDDVPIFLEPSIEELVPVPKALLGKVIGKQAQTIIEIREKSGAFKVDARDQTSDPCQVKVAGTAEAVRKARALIMELIDSTKTKHVSSHYVEIPRSKIGMVIGLKGAQVNEVQQQTNTKIDVDFESDPCKCYIKGDDECVESAKKLLLTIAMQMEDEASEYMDLPKTASGALIGAQGSRIRAFQEQSGARIDIDKSGDRCKVRLTGTQEQLTIAKSLIQTELEKTMTPTRTPSQRAMGFGAPLEPMVIPAHQPTSFPATVAESIARARAAAEAVKHGLISPMQPGPPPPGGCCGCQPMAALPAPHQDTGVVVPPPPRPMGGCCGQGGQWSPGPGW
eukprot:TRINITY_DN102018_c0_g1_i1.p1 TRINITY_DN102018_c0_g1~~TRINITY_DN102018_c0_g1_i1.p1  ORF type:complete len:557 (+),score=129.37 TRINITY_DN102018_c0_g1_i1:68-1738(+)